MNENYFGVVFLRVENISNVIMPFAIVTAHNPMDFRLDELKNSERNERLRKDLHQSDFIYREIIGCSEDHTHQELSFVVKCNLKQAIQMGNKFEQRAIFWVEGDKLQIVDCKNLKSYDLGSFKKRFQNQST
tara:strand:+ start:468 stop:860 length:393 start_codon:yes stop_codon:yes gene_type:complete